MSRAGKQYNFYVRARQVFKYNPSVHFPGCEFVHGEVPTQSGHTAACKSRIMHAMLSDREVRHRARSGCDAKGVDSGADDKYDNGNDGSRRKANDEECDPGAKGPVQVQDQGQRARCQHESSEWSKRVEVGREENRAKRRRRRRTRWRQHKVQGHVPQSLRGRTRWLQSVGDRGRVPHNRAHLCGHRQQNECEHIRRTMQEATAAHEVFRQNLRRDIRNQVPSGHRPDYHRQDCSQRRGQGKVRRLRIQEGGAPCRRSRCSHECHGEAAQLRRNTVVLVRGPSGANRPRRARRRPGKSSSRATRTRGPPQGSLG